MWEVTRHGQAANGKGEPIKQGVCKPKPGEIYALNRNETELQDPGPLNFQSYALPLKHSEHDDLVAVFDGISETEVFLTTDTAYIRSGLTPEQVVKRWKFASLHALANYFAGRLSQAPDPFEGLLLEALELSEGALAKLEEWAKQQIAVLGQARKTLDDDKQKWTREQDDRHQKLAVLEQALLNAESKLDALDKQIREHEKSVEHKKDELAKLDQDLIQRQTLLAPAARSQLEREVFFKGRSPFSTDLTGEMDALHQSFETLHDSRGTDFLQLLTLHLALKHAPFTVLSGASGSGKTSLLVAYAEEMGIYAHIIPVQPGWTSVQDLHGYVNPLGPGNYHSTPFFRALKYQMRANYTPDPSSEPLDLVLLDEINLSHVEYFLADYLSAFELKTRHVSLMSPGEAQRLALFENGKPDEQHPDAWLREAEGRVTIPRSFLIAGTANEDATTRGFSDKFRDRASFLEVKAPEPTSWDKLNRKASSPEQFISRAGWLAWQKEGEGQDTENPLLALAQQLYDQDFPVSMRVFQRAHRMYADGVRLLRALGHYSTISSLPTEESLLAQMVQLNLVHKYRSLFLSDAKRNALIEAFEKGLVGLHESIRPQILSALQAHS